MVLKDGKDGILLMHTQYIKAS